MRRSKGPLRCWKSLGRGVTKLMAYTSWMVRQPLVQYRFVQPKLLWLMRVACVFGIAGVSDDGRPKYEKVLHDPRCRLAMPCFVCPRSASLGSHRVSGSFASLSHAVSLDALGGGG